MFPAVFDFSSEVQNALKLRAGVGQFRRIDLFEEQADIPEYLFLVQFLSKQPFLFGAYQAAVSGRNSQALMEDKHREVGTGAGHR